MSKAVKYGRGWWVSNAGEGYSHDQIYCLLLSLLLVIVMYPGARSR